MDKTAQQDLQGPLVYQESLELLVTLGHRAQLDQLVFQVLLVQMVQQGPLGPLGLAGALGFEVLLVLLDLQGLQDCLVPRVYRGQLEGPVLSVIQDPQDLLEDQDLWGNLV